MQIQGAEENQLSINTSSNQMQSHLQVVWQEGAWQHATRGITEWSQPSWLALQAELVAQMRALSVCTPSLVSI